MAFRQNTHPAHGLFLSALPAARVQQHCPGRALQAGKHVFVGFVELEHTSGGFEAGDVSVIVQPPHDIQAEATGVGEVLPLPQSHQRGRRADMTVPEAGKVHAGVVAGPCALRPGGQARIGGGFVYPVGAAVVHTHLAAHKVYAVDGELGV